MASSKVEHHETIIIGAGFGGICLAIKLLEAGHEDLILLEKSSDIGGTWNYNTYPGAACDIPSALYSYSFAQNPAWAASYAGQTEILGYMRQVAEKYGVLKRVQLGIKMESASWDANSSTWAIEATDESGGSKSYSARFFVSAVGQLHHPKMPDVPGIEDFEGKSCHSAKWDHSMQLTGKNVAVIGTGASAIQLIPEVTKVAKSVHVVQRSPPWTMVLPQTTFSYKEWLFSKFPFLMSFERFFIWSFGEYVLFPAMLGSWFSHAILRIMTLGSIYFQVSCPKKRSNLIPDYPIGTKRILLAANFYPAVNRDHVSLHAQGLVRVNKRGIELKDGATIDDLDAIVYATGFEVTPFLKDMKIFGRDQTELHDYWNGCSRAYLGMTVPKFPNFFIIYGPNTNLGSGSIIGMIEAQSRYIIKAILHLDATKSASLEIKEDDERKFNDEMQERLQKTVWAKGRNWYREGKSISVNWPGSTVEYTKRTEKFDASLYDVVA